jgi:hypothetical protein
VNNYHPNWNAPANQNQGGPQRWTPPGNQNAPVNNYHPNWNAPANQNQGGPQRWTPPGNQNAPVNNYHPNWNAPANQGGPRRDTPAYRQPSQGCQGGSNQSCGGRDQGSTNH